ncbi:MAG: serine/threonine protein kinase [Polyangiales bacterium]
MSDAVQPEASQGTGPGTLVGGRFRIEKKLAAGGMGVVYRAVQEPLGRPVALKVLRKPQDSRMDETYSQRFLLEAAVVANLNHPNTVVVHDYGNDGGLLYFAMEYVDGLTLSEHVKKNGPITPEEGVHVAKQIASSLIDAHGDGLVHRDLKPGNVMLLKRGGDPLFVKVLDFGLVKLAGGTDEQKKKLTQSGILMGSPRYMAPEQVRGTDVDARTDIYSFGALLCFILTGKPPFSAGSQFEAMRAHVHTPAPTLKDLAPDIQASLGLESVVAQCLAKDPAGRFQSMEEVFAALDMLNSEARVSAPNPRPTMMQGGVEPSGAELSAPLEHTNSSVTSFLTQAIVAPGKSKAKWVTRITLMALVVAVGVSLAILIPKGEEPTATTLPPLANTPETPPIAEPPEVIPPVAPVTEPVSIQVTPSSADITRDGVLLGNGSIELDIPSGERWELTLEADGYEPRTITVTSQSQPLSLTLEEVVEDEPEARPERERTPRPRDTSMTRMRPDMEQSSQMTLSPIRDPWD